MESLLFFLHFNINNFFFFKKKGVVAPDLPFELKSEEEQKRILAAKGF
jgi:hypothetical protein